MDAYSEITVGTIHRIDWRSHHTYLMNHILYNKIFKLFRPIIQAEIESFFSHQENRYMHVMLLYRAFLSHIVQKIRNISDLPTLAAIHSDDIKFYMNASYGTELYESVPFVIIINLSKSSISGDYMLDLLKHRNDLCELDYHLLKELKFDQCGKLRLSTK